MNESTGRMMPHRMQHREAIRVTALSMLSGVGCGDDLRQYSSLVHHVRRRLSPTELQWIPPGVAVDSAGNAGLDGQEMRRW